MNEWRLLVTNRWVTAALSIALSTWLAVPIVAQGKRAFTVADDIETVHFGDAYGSGDDPIKFAPDDNYVAVCTERGRLDLKLPEDSIRIYRTADILNFLHHPQGNSPQPVWNFSRLGDRNEPVIQEWRWLSDSSGLAFIEAGSDGERLFLADLKTKAIAALTPVGQRVSSFDIRNRSNFVYAVNVGIPLLRERDLKERESPAVVATDRLWSDVLFPADSVPRSDRNEIWAVIAGKRFPVKNNADGRPIIWFRSSALDSNLALSPDGSSVATVLPVFDVPSSWQSLYPEPYPSANIRQFLRSGRRNSDALESTTEAFAYQYATINLRSGLVRSVTNAPLARSAGWGSTTLLSRPTWSANGRKILLPGTFLSAQPHTAPCVAVADYFTGLANCVVSLTPESPQSTTSSGQQGQGYRWLMKSGFTSADGNSIFLGVQYFDRRPLPDAIVEYHQAAYGRWLMERETPVQDAKQPIGDEGRVRLYVKQTPSIPPTLVAVEKPNESEQLIWDPNPEFKDIELTDVTRYEWKDKAGRNWWGLLYKPRAYEKGQRYPLVIQTHGAPAYRFESSGAYPSGMAARALAGAGIAVLQVPEIPCGFAVLDEAACPVAGYEAGAEKLFADGLADRERIGIVGFSRSCYWALAAMTNGSLHFKAAVLTDGVVFSYSQYLLYAGNNPGGAAFRREAEAAMGAKPFASGLKEWLARSPTLSLEKVNAPVLLVALGRPSLLGMWTVYGGLSELHKPIDLVLINSDRHILTNPRDREISQGGTVDWFRFWLKNEEDPDPAKVEQYKRWRELRKLQEANMKSVETKATEKK